MKTRLATHATKEAISNRPLALVTEVGCLPSVGASKEAVEGHGHIKEGTDRFMLAVTMAHLLQGWLQIWRSWALFWLSTVSFSSSSYATCISMRSVH